MKPNSKPWTSAFSRIELLVIVAVVVLLGGVLFPKFIQAKRKAKQISCVSNLKIIGLAFRIWGGDHGERFPMALSVTNGGALEVSNQVWRSFQILSNELTVPLLLACPTDVRRPATNFSSLANSNISYFIGLDADESMPELLLAGDFYLSTGRPTVNKVLTIQTNDMATWSTMNHEGRGDVALADGSVQQFSADKLRVAVKSALKVNWETNANATLRLAMPE